MKITNLTPRANTLSTQDDKAKTADTQEPKSQNAKNTSVRNTQAPSTNADSSAKATSLESTRTSSQQAQAVSDLGEFAKNANNTIGSLDVMIHALSSLKSHNKAFEKVAHKFQATDSNSDEAQNLAKKASSIKEKMQAIFDTATFDKENVFTKNYRDLIPENKLDSKKVAPNKLSVKEPENLTQYTKDVSEQQAYAKQAKRLMKQALQERADAVQKTDSSFNNLDRAKLNEQEFKAAQGSSGVTLDRVLHLLR